LLSKESRSLTPAIAFPSYLTANNVPLRAWAKTEMKSKPQLAAQAYTI
jgi:hypothetical protein